MARNLEGFLALKDSDRDRTMAEGTSVFAVCQVIIMDVHPGGHAHDSAVSVAFSQRPVVASSAPADPGSIVESLSCGTPLPPQPSLNPDPATESREGMQKPPLAEQEQPQRCGAANKHYTNRRRSHG
jgi:hypothetical protein